MKQLLILSAGVLVVCAAFAAGPPPKVNEADLRKQFTNLKDQDSAKFRNIKFAPTERDGAWVMCGEYNAKNSYGGYAGFSRFTGVVMVEGRKTTYFVSSTDGDVANPLCAKHGL